MAYTVQEKVESRQITSGPNPQTRLIYLVKDDSDPQAADPDLGARDAVATASPTAYNGWPRRTIRITPRSDRVWESEVIYQPGQITPEGPTPPDVGSYSVDIGRASGTIRVTNAPEAAKYPPGAESHGGAINVDENGVRGVDIRDKVIPWTETHVFASGTLSWATVITRKLFENTVNNASFRGFAAGEVRLDALTASYRSDDELQLVYEFIASPNITGLAIGELTGIAKKGHQYLWVQYRKKAEGNQITRTPLAAYVHDVYEEADFSLLGIGTGVPPL